MWKMGFLCIFFAEDKCGNWMSMIANWFSSSLPILSCLWFCGELHTYCFKKKKWIRHQVLRCAMQARVQKVWMSVSNFAFTPRQEFSCYHHDEYCISWLIYHPTTYVLKEDGVIMPLDWKLWEQTLLIIGLFPALEEVKLGMWIEGKRGLKAENMWHLWPYYKARGII